MKITYWINEKEDRSQELAQEMRQANIEFISIPTSGVSILEVDGLWKAYGVSRIRVWLQNMLAKHR